MARAAGRLVVDERPADLRVASKSTDTDPVTVMDQRSQELSCRLLAQERPDDAVMGEEEGGATGTSGLTWVVDPIDGTVNYLYGIPSYAVSRRGRHRRPRPAGPLGVGGRGGAQPRDRRAVPRPPRRRRPADDRPGHPHAAGHRGHRPGHGAGRHRVRVRAPRCGPARRPCWSTCCPGCATSGGTAVRPSTCAAWRPAGSTPTTRRRSTRGTARPVSSSPRGRVRSSAGRSTTCRPATWSGVRRPGWPRSSASSCASSRARHVGPMD